MSKESLIQSITYNPQEYLEVVLCQPLEDELHVFFLNDPKRLSCFVHLGKRELLYYDTQNKISLKHYLNHHPVTKKELKEWCLFLLDQIENATSYYLFNPEYIFVDEASKQLILCEIPQTSKPNTAIEYATLLLEIYGFMNYEGEEEWVSQMYLLLKQQPFRLPLFRQFLVSKKQKKWLSIFKKEEDDQLNDFFKMMYVKEEEPAYALSTVPFETQILMAGYQYGYLVNEMNQKILITSSPWTMGRNKECHLYLESPEISKQHCQLIVEQGSCFLEDLNSTNGTKLNGQKLEAYQKVALKDLDEIQLARHLYIYHA